MLNVVKLFQLLRHLLNAVIIIIAVQRLPF